MIIATDGQNGDWFMVVGYTPAGYIKDDDAKTWNADELLTGLREAGLSLLTWTRGATELRNRLAFAHAALGEPWPDVSDTALLDHAEDWLDLRAARRRADLVKIDVAAGLRRLLPWSVAGRLDEVAPERLPVPSGSHVRSSCAGSTGSALPLRSGPSWKYTTARSTARGASRRCSRAK